jgi:hypothetical protein
MGNGTILALLFSQGDIVDGGVYNVDAAATMVGGDLSLKNPAASAFLPFRECCWIWRRSAQKGLCYTFDHGEQQELIEKIKRLPQDWVAEVEDFVDSLARREPCLDQISLHQALTNYAIQHAGTDADLDPDLEAAATDDLLTA